MEWKCIECGAPLKNSDSDLCDKCIDEALQNMRDEDD